MSPNMHGMISQCYIMVRADPAVSENRAQVMVHTWAPAFG